MLEELKREVAAIVLDPARASVIKRAVAVGRLHRVLGGNDVRWVFRRLREGKTTRAIHVGLLRRQRERRHRRRVGDVLAMYSLRRGYS